MHNERAIQNGDSTRRESRTESGELERPEPKRRKIDCGAEPSDSERRPLGPERRSSGFARQPSPES